MKENKVRMEYEIAELKTRNLNLEERFKSSSECNCYNELNDAVEQSDDSGMNEQLFSQGEYDLDQNDFKERHKVRSTISAKQLNKNSSPDMIKTKNKYYKKYLQYKKMYLDLQAQNTETKDRAISSLVDKEKKIMKLCSQFEEKEKEYLNEIKDLRLATSFDKEDTSVSSNMFSETADELSTKISKSNENYLKQKLFEIKIDKENTVKRLNFDFQALKTKYNEDMEYYKTLLSQQTRDSVAEDDFEGGLSPQKSLMMNKIIDELRENEEHYIKDELNYKLKIAELESKVIDYEEALYEKEN